MILSKSNFLNLNQLQMGLAICCSEVFFGISGYTFLFSEVRNIRSVHIEKGFSPYPFYEVFFQTVIPGKHKLNGGGFFSEYSGVNISIPTPRW